jgi:signal transduction histidine kinase
MKDMLEILDSQVNLIDILDHIPVPAGLISLASGKYVAVNLALRQLAQYGEDVRDHLLPLILDNQKIQRLQQGEIIQGYELELPNSQGQTCAFLLSAKLVSYQGDRLIFCVLQDITGYKIRQLQQLDIQQTLETDLQESAIPSIHESLASAVSERTQILQKLQSSPHLLNQCIAYSPCIFYIFDLDRQTTLYINPESLHKLGYTPATLDDIARADRPAVMEHFANCRHLAHGQTRELDYRIQPADQSSRWWRSYHTPLAIDEDGLVHQIAGVAIDITAQKQAEQALAESEQRNRAILQVIPDLIMRLHRDGTCLECLSPGSPQRFLTVQNHISEILPPPLWQKLLEAITTALDQQSLQVYEQEIDRSGKLCVEEIRVVAVGAEEVLVSVRDISDRRIANQHQLELAQDKECRIFAILSHELRTPLSTILGSVELLQYSHAQWLDDKAKRNLNRISISVQDALELLENMLTLSRANAGNLQVKPQYINLRRFTEELVDSITTQRQIIVNCKTSAEDYMGYTDPFLLRRLLLNLLNNAIKYSAVDTEIRVFLLINLEQDQAIWQIIDKGVGIRSAELEQIFLPWKRGSNTDHTRGTGLGLSVVQNCARMIGGVVSVLSQENVGTTFTVIVPIAGADNV